MTTVTTFLGDDALEDPSQIDMIQKTLESSILNKPSIKKIKTTTSLPYREKKHDLRKKSKSSSLSRKKLSSSKSKSSRGKR